MKQTDILLVGQTPPPYHGQAIVTGMLFEDDWEGLVVSRLRMAYSDSIDEVGKASISKVFHLFGLIAKTLKIGFFERPRIFYYLPASSNKAAVIRDVIYLSAVKWCFKKVVFHYHAGGLPEYIAGAGLLGKLGRFVYNNADVSVEICQTEYPPAKAFNAKKQVFIPNGLDIKNMPVSAERGAEFTLLFMGALNEGKGVMVSLQAARLLKSMGKTFQMNFAGAWASDEFAKECDEFIKKYDLGSCVTFLGVIKGDDKWQGYADADVFLFPSFYQSENFPLVLIEAMGCGLPVITTKWRGIPQLVEGSDAAVLCDIKNIDEVVSAIVLFMEDEGYRDECAQNAIQHYAQNYTRNQFVNAMRDQFERLLD